MRALVYDGPWQIAVQERPDPVAGEGQALVRVLATGICGSDLHGFTGENGRRHPGQVMGHETVVEVVELAGPADGVRVGDVVTLNPVLGCGHCAACLAGETQRCLTKRVIGVEPTLVAAMAQAMAVPVGNLVPLPAGLAPDLGALVEPLAVGFHAVRRGGVGPEAAVLVVGAGPIGQALALAARRLGAERVVVSEPDALRRELVSSLGFSVVDPGAGDLADAIREQLGEAPSVVVDGVGSSRSMHDALTVSAPLATVVLVGMEQPRLELDAYRVSTEERSVVGSFCYSVADFSSTAAWVGEQGDALLPLIDRRVGLDGAAEAFRTLADGSLRASKVLIYPQGLPGEGTGADDAPAASAAASSEAQAGGR